MSSAPTTRAASSATASEPSHGAGAVALPGTERPAAAGAADLPRTFGLKDIFTCINILCGVLAILFCIEGQLRYAAYAFLSGFIFGDSLDGFVARRTGTANRFGAEFDVIGDHLVQCIVPAAMLYVAYRPLSPYLATALATVLVISGSIRHARGAVASPGSATAYIGMPRTVSSFLVVSYLNSAWVSYLPAWRWVGVALVLFVSVAHLLPIPFRNHKGRPLKPWAKYFVTAFFAMTIGGLLLLPQYVFDITFLWLAGYSTTSWLEMDGGERRAFFVEARRWSRAVRAAR